tara:strand:- start:34 stop:537 length:504 start_codon:yes stop_codon:yes gene_type:complete
MQKKVLSEQSLYYGDVAMPKDWDIDRDKLLQDILSYSFTNKEFPFSKTWDMLNTYIKDHVRVEHDLSLINKNSWGDIYKPSQLSKPLLDVDPVDLRNSPDFTMLYGVNVNNCWIKIYYEDNRRKGRSWDIELTNNKFIIFPATNMYTISNEQKDNLNFIQTITYEYI